MTLIRIFVYSLAFLLFACTHGQVKSTPTTPPPAFFVSAGPLALPTDNGGTSVCIKYVLAIHSMAPKRIQIIDAKTGQVIIDDLNPQLRPSQLKHRAVPSLSFSEWEGRTVMEPITESLPTWLHDGVDTKVKIEARVFTDSPTPFTDVQPATYGIGTKNLILMSTGHNRSFNKK